MDNRLLILVLYVVHNVASSTIGATDSATTSPVTPTAASPEGVTLLKPASSFLEYRPTWPAIGDEISLGLTFRTLTPNALLLHHTILEVPGEYRPELSIRLDHGVLVVQHEYGDVTERILVAKGMSHDRWHTIKVSLSLLTKELTAQVDDREKKTQGLKAFVETRVGEAYQPGAKTSVLSIGGFSSDTRQPGLYVGCLKDLSLYNDATQLDLSVYALDESGGVVSGCQSACESNNPCQNSGRCVNLYTKTECDCFNTGYHGYRCELEGLLTVTLPGGEWIRYNVYEDHESERNHLPGIRIAMDFRTSKPEGVLFYASETSPQYNHLAVSLQAGVLHVSVVFEDRETHSELYTTIGKDINDGRWHSLTVVHEGKDVRIRLDDKTENMDAKHSHPHLNMPETVYFAGIDEGNLGIGLRSQESFIGCLRKLYYNHINVLDHMSNRTSYSGPTSQPTYKCQDVHTTSVQFQHDGSYAQILSTEADSFELEFEFRTFKPDTLLFHAELGTYDYQGYMKGFLVKKRLEVHIVPSSYNPDERQIITVGKNLNKAQWHSVKVFYKSGLTQVWVNKGFKAVETKWDLSFNKATYFGYAPDMFDEKRSYIGCMKHISVQGTDVDPLPLIQSDLSVGLSLGPCELTNWCKLSNPCLNKGLCVSEWYKPYCDCSRNLFEGRHCQFSQLKTSCEEHFLNGEREPAIRHLDLDGIGPMKPVYAQCDFGLFTKGRKYGVTEIDHNLAPYTKIRTPGLVDMKKLLEYRGMTEPMLKKVVADAAFCRQYMTINCYRTFLGLGRQTYFTSIHNETFARVGGSEERACTCNEDDSCIDNRFQCNCDQRSGRWVQDAGYIEDKKEVPITEMTFLQEYGGRANMTLGPLECMGKATQTDDTVVSFTTPHSYIDGPGWTGGSIEVIFRTLEASAILLYQHGQNNTYHDTQLVAELASAHSVTVRATNPAINITLNTTVDLTSGDWQYLKLEVSHGQMKASVGGVQTIVDLTEGFPGKYATRLYVGGKPIRYTEGGNQGIVGCIGGVTYDGQTLPLSKLAEGRYDVYPGCLPQCESDPCQNGATCHEYWSSYECTCVNKYAHSGEQCENNINTDSVKFTNEAGYLRIPSKTMDLLGEDYLFSFRTTQKRALLLYINDENNNFIQADIEAGEVFHFSYNSGSEINHVRVQVNGITDGLWKQVAVQSEQGRLILDVEGNVENVDDKRMPLLTYSQVPFTNEESIVPFRNMKPVESGTWVNVGGVPQDYVAFEGLKGCLRGLKIGENLVDLSEAADGLNSILPGCPSGCETVPCKNGGRCFDDIDFNDAYTCDCSATGEAGKHCTEEVGLYFRGDGQIEQFLRSVPDSTIGGQTDRIELAFATSTHSQKKSALAFVRGRTGLSDYLLVYLTYDNGVKVAVNVQVQDKKLTLVDSNHAADGRPHRVVVERQGSKLVLKVDDTVTEGDIDGGISLSYNPPAILDVAWVRKDNFRFLDIENFTGDIWNVFFTSDALGVVNARPLEVYSGYDDGNHGITVTGGVAPVSQSLDGIKSAYMYRNVWAETDDNSGHLADYKSARARTIYLVDPNADGENEGASPAVAFVVCGIALVFFIGLTLFLVLRHRRRQRNPVTVSLKTEDNRDEEEGLLGVSDTATNDDYAAIATAKLRQGPKRSKSTELDGDIDEETPMLQSEEPLSETSPPGQESIPLDTFKKSSGVVSEDDAPPVPPKNLTGAPEVTQAPTEQINPAELDTPVPMMPEGTYTTRTPPPTPEAGVLDTPIPQINVAAEAAQAPPKPPRAPSIVEPAPEETDTSGQENVTSEPKKSEQKDPEVTEAEVQEESQTSAKQTNETSEITAETQAVTDSAPAVTEESEDDGQPNDIQIKAEVHEPSEGSSTGSTSVPEGDMDTVVSATASSADNGQDADAIMEIVSEEKDKDTEGSTKKAGSKRRKGKKGSKH